jgi:hypothetical protein
VVDICAPAPSGGLAVSMVGTAVEVLLWVLCQALRFPPAVVASLIFRPAVAQDLGLDLKEIGLNGGGTTHAPQERWKPQRLLGLSGIPEHPSACATNAFACIIAGAAGESH